MVRLNIREARLDNKSPRNKKGAGTTLTIRPENPKIRNLPPCYDNRGQYNHYRRGHTEITKERMLRSACFRGAFPMGATLPRLSIFRILHCAAERTPSYFSSTILMN